MTAMEIACALRGKDVDGIRGALEVMPDVYIDRWEGPKRGQYTAVWCIVVPPPHCPRPTKQAA